MVDKIRDAYHNHDYFESINLCNQVIEKIQRTYNGYFYKGLNLVELKLYEEARHNLEIARKNLRKNKFQKILPEDFHDIAIGIGRTYLGQRMITEAINEITLTINQFPKTVRGYLFKAKIFSDDDDYISAIDTINEGLKNNKKNKGLIDYKNYLTFYYIENRKDEKNKASKNN